MTPLCIVIKSLTYHAIGDCGAYETPFKMHISVHRKFIVKMLIISTSLHI